MYRQFYGLTGHSFTKDVHSSKLFISRDLKEFMSRMEYLKTVRGIAVVFGEPGAGKTTALRAFVDSLNPQQYSPVYLPLASVTVIDFYRHLAVGLSLLPRFRKVDIYHQLQQYICNQSSQHGQIHVIIVDEAHHLRHELLHELQMIMNFHMDSKSLAILILAGTSSIVPMIKIRIHDSFLQRVVVHHEFTGLEPNEAAPQLESVLKAAGAVAPIFTPDASAAIYQLSHGMPRLINQIASEFLLVGCAHEARAIDSKIVQEAVADNLRISVGP
jgi:general secretion pathway protein A